MNDPATPMDPADAGGRAPEIAALAPRGRGARSVRDPRPAQLAYAVASPDEGRRILRTIAERFRTRSAPKPRRRATFYDTFDWRLHADGGDLRARPSAGHWIVTWTSRTGTVRHRAILPAPPAFAWDLPDGGFRDDLGRVAGVRRLLPVVLVELGGAALRVLNADEKTVARLELEEGAAAPPQGGGSRRLPPRLRLIETRGYPEARDDVAGALAAVPGLARDDAGVLALALETIGVRACAYSSKLGLDLDPALPAGIATRRVLRALLETMTANEPGTCADVDTEFLHDFRVAVRRTRTALAQLKGVLPADVVERYRAEFSWLGDLTGPTRDLDVHLLRMREHEGELPPDVVGDLEPFARFLGARRQAALSLLVAGLRSDRYRELADSWRAFLDTGAAAGDSPPDAARPIADVARERIASRFDRVLSRGRRLHAGSPPARLHRLRISCKKLRYLLEFFRSLCAPAEVAGVVEELKRLQDNLGESNDLRIQQASLNEFARQMLVEGLASARTLVAMGRLVERLDARRTAELARFEGCFAGFAGRENRQRIARILAPTAGGPA